MKLVALCKNNGICLPVAKELSIFFYQYPTKIIPAITLSTVPFSSFKARMASSCFRILIAYFCLRFVFKVHQNYLGWSFHHKILNLIILESLHCYINSKTRVLCLGSLGKQLLHLPHFKI